MHAQNVKTIIGEWSRRQNMNLTSLIQRKKVTLKLQRKWTKSITTNFWFPMLDNLIRQSRYLRTWIKHLTDDNKQNDRADRKRRIVRIKRLSCKMLQCNVLYVRKFNYWLLLTKVVSIARTVDEKLLMDRTSSLWYLLMD